VGCTLVWMSHPKYSCLVELGMVPSWGWSDAATAINSVISTNVQGTSSDGSVIEKRSRLYRQLSELRELQSTGLLTEDEYKTEKDSIMKFLTQLKS